MSVPVFVSSAVASSTLPATAVLALVVIFVALPSKSAIIVAFVPVNTSFVLVASVRKVNLLAESS